jgi:hypothetical protein
MVIPCGTPVKLQLVWTISSARAQTGDRLDFVVVEDVTAGGYTIIQAGTIAWLELEAGAFSELEARSSSSWIQSSSPPAIGLRYEHERRLRGTPGQSSC